MGEKGRWGDREIKPLAISNTSKTCESKHSIRKEEDNTMASVLKVKGMSCNHCVMSVTKALGKLEGLQNVKVDLQKGEVSFDNTKALGSEKIEKAITDAGFEVVK
jgi:copper ion binding protein